MMGSGRAGLWLIGAYGGVGTTVAVGLSALARGTASLSGLVTALPAFEACDLADPADLVIGGHELRQSSYVEAADILSQKAGILSSDLLKACRNDLADASARIRPGLATGAGKCIEQMADWPDATRPESCRATIARLQKDWSDFRATHDLEQMVVINVASTEPPCPPAPCHDSLDELAKAIHGSDRTGLPASSLYAYAAIDAGYPYVNFTPSQGASTPALQKLAIERSCPIAGQDAKTGETLIKSVLAPMFLARNLKVLSWFGQNLIGNRDGQVLRDPANKSAKIASKDQVIAGVLGYQPQTQIGIEYVPSLDDWKTAWDFIHFQGFLGVKMSMQFTWQGCDSILAAPLVIDLARLALLAQRRGERGVMGHLACFFKSPLGVDEHDFFKQFEALLAYASACGRPVGMKVAEVLNNAHHA
jgi:myo-inositol-1-phosphate synthase